MEVVIAIISFIGGFFVEKVIDYFYERIKNIIKYMKAKHDIKGMLENVQRENPDILPLAFGKPYFNPAAVEVSIDARKQMYLAFPQEKVRYLMDSSGKFADTDIFFKPMALDLVPDDEFRYAIEEARQKVADDFIERKNGLYFNGEKYGVLMSDGFSRTCDDVEIPILSYRMFLTDYFTEQVMSRAVKNILPKEFEFTQEKLNDKMNFIRTSMGVSVIVVLKSSNQIIMTRRARNTSFSEGKTWIYVSVTEGFTSTDFDAYIGKPRLDFCVKRGLLEELNIDESMYSASSMNFLDTFFETSFLQDGIVCAVQLDENVKFNDLLVNAKKAKDSELEVDKIFLIDNNKKTIKDFINANSEDMRAQTKFALESYCARMD